MQLPRGSKPRDRSRFHHRSVASISECPLAASIGLASGVRTKRAERTVRAVDRLNLTG